MKKLLLLTIFLLLLGSGLFYLYGRSIWHPYYVKLRGAQTITQVVERVKQERGTTFNPNHWRQLLLLGLKDERILEVWGITPQNTPVKITEFPFTAYSGKLGPKLRNGDRQIPEGVYRIEYLNPNSSYHLSMKLDYPNAFDRKKASADGRSDLGNDIFIHGRAATIGCIPIGDQGIEELFLMVAEMGPDQVDVILCPYDFRQGHKELQIPGIEWEQELYTQINQAIAQKLPRPVISSGQ